MRYLILLAAPLASLAADFKDIDPAVFPATDPRAKDLPKIVAADAKRRMQEANLRESKAFAAVATLAQWEEHRDARVANLRASLGTFPVPPADMRVVTTKTLAGDGFTIRNVLYETRPGLWVSANLYLPAKEVAKMPGILIAHAHHTPKADGELQDMGMTWARAGAAVLVPDQLGYGERRQHDFRAAADHDKPFRVGRQDYFFRYNSNLQLAAAGDSLMGWMAWDLMRGVDVLLKQPGIDKDRIILLGSVAGGGDPAGVTAALDPRIACVVSFNFGGWQPESSALENPDRDFAWFGDGYWESTRGLRGGAAGGFAHYVIVGSVAPRKVIYAHEFAWPEKDDPAWPRLQRVFGFYDAKDNLRVAHGAGSVRNSGPGNTHCNHIGAVHRKMIYPALKDWFGMPIPVEYSQRRPSAELMCWTDAAKKELQPKKLHEVLAKVAEEQFAALKTAHASLTPEAKAAWYRKSWTRLLGDTDPPAATRVTGGVGEKVPGGTLLRYEMAVEPGIVVPILLVLPQEMKGKPPVVVMVSSAGKQAFLKERSAAIEAFLAAGVAVCLPDVRGTGETRGGTAADRGSSRTSLSQTSLILGRPVLGTQLRDLRAVVRWLRTLDGVDGKALALWGDSFAPTNAPDTRPVPHDLEQPAIAEPGGPILAGLAAFFEGGVRVLYTRGGLVSVRSLFDSPYPNVPHEAVVPGVVPAGGYVVGGTVRQDGLVTARNTASGDKPPSPAEAAAWVVKELGAK